MNGLKSISNIKTNIDGLNKIEGKFNIMEVCGTHTNAISKLGIRNILKSDINLISGPGCPVCVTPDSYIDYVYNLSLEHNITVATYGDMIRVPGSKPNITLENAKAHGADIRMVYSSIDAVNIAAGYRNKKVVFLGIGFETTAPHSAIAVIESEKLKLKNFFLLSLHKKVEPIMRSLLEDSTIKIDGFLCPGHVAAIIGEDGFQFLESYGCAGAIAGFEFQDITQGIESIIQDIIKKDYTLKNCYKRLVKKEGNLAAISMINNVFESRDDLWRGMGKVSKSGLKLKQQFSLHDIETIYPVNLEERETNSCCQCGEVLKGKIKPYECKLFDRVCSPENPIGPCMVSDEGSCAAYYRFR